MNAQTQPRPGTARIDPDADILESALESTPVSGFVSWETLGKHIARGCSPQDDGYGSVQRARKRLKIRGIDFAPGVNGGTRGLIRLDRAGMLRKTHSVMGTVRRASRRQMTVLAATDMDGASAEESAQRIGHLTVLGMIAKVATKRSTDKVLQAVQDNGGKTLPEMATTKALFGIKD